MQTQKLALISDKGSLPEYENLNLENGKLFAFLKEKGLQVSVEVWDDEKVDWSKFDAVIIKTPWDYYYRIQEFTAWLDKLERIGAYMLNPIPLIRWNSDKIYFKELIEEGVKMVPTIWLEQNSSLDIEIIFSEIGTDKIIIKPRVSGGAKHTYALTKEEAIARKEELEGYMKEEAFLAQPFLKEIQTKGEWALLFFNGKYSHSVLKTAKANDFRVQHMHGGAIHKVDAPANLVATAQDIVDRFAKDCLYTRVDGLEIDGEFVLMELEALEPHLFLNESENAMEMYYQGLLSLMDKKTPKN